MLCTGKTSLLLNFTTDQYKENTRTTVGVDLKIKLLTINNHTLKLTIWDTAGQERFRTLTSSYYRGAHGIILMYDITNRTTYNNIKHWLNEIDIYCTNQNYIKLLIGNKLDLLSTQSDTQPGSTRAVSRSEALEFAKRNNMLYMETSAKSGDNIKLAFNELCTKILQQAQLSQTDGGEHENNSNINLNHNAQSNYTSACGGCISGQ